MTTRIMVVDDHVTMRDGLSMVLSSDPDLEVVGTASSGPEAVRLAATVRPDVVFLDVEMPGGDGISAIRPLLEVAPSARILMLTMFDLDDYVARAMREGAHGFLLKTADSRQLLAAVRTTCAGETVLAPGVLHRVVTHFAEGHASTAESSPSLARLTDREREVLALMCDGLSNAEIADHLVVELPTVKSHVAHILQKLPARDRLQAVVLAHRAGIA